MDNKYGLGSNKVATEHHEKHPKTAAPLCKFCGATTLHYSPTLHDHQCEACNEWQMDVCSFLEGLDILKTTQFAESTVMPV